MLCSFRYHSYICIHTLLYIYIYIYIYIHSPVSGEKREKEITSYFHKVQKEYIKSNFKASPEINFVVVSLPCLFLGSITCNNVVND